jgi:hypothetical protein
MFMTLDQRIPTLTDPELSNLHDNAVRLARSGAPAQKTEAERLLPLIGAEVDARARARSDALAAARRARKPRAKAGQA